MVKDFVEAMRRLDLNVGIGNAMSHADYSKRIFDTCALPIDLRLLLSEKLLDFFERSFESLQ